MTSLHTRTLETPVGPVELWASARALVGAHLEGWPRPAALPAEETGARPEGASAAATILEHAATELEEYFRRERRAFTVPLALPTTPFHRAVLEALRALPHGATTTYGALAAAVGRPGAARAVGTAMGRNPLALFVPCHRVVGADGSLTGFAGGLPRKEWLLAHEGATVRPRGGTSAAR